MQTARRRRRRPGLARLSSSTARLVSDLMYWSAYLLRRGSHSLQEFFRRLAQGNVVRVLIKLENIWLLNPIRRLNSQLKI